MTDDVQREADIRGGYPNLGTYTPEEEEFDDMAVILRLLDAARARETELIHQNEVLADADMKMLREFQARAEGAEKMLQVVGERVAELEQQLVEQYTKFGDLILAGGRLLSEAESRVATLEHVLREARNALADYAVPAPAPRADVVHRIDAALAASPSKEAAP